MAKAKKKSVKSTKKILVSPFNVYWDKTNYILLAVGILFVIIGFYVMSLGDWDSTTSLVVSPIILFIGYVIIFPLSILFKKKTPTNVVEESKEVK